MKIHFFLILSFAINIVSGSTPFDFSLSYHGGYDSNVMRLSEPEIENASLNKSVMGSANTLDSYINKVNVRLNKNLFQNGKKELMLSSSYSFSSYAHNPNKDYWSGNTVFTYKWGSYKNIKYSNQHLNSYYLRHYIDRDISKDNLRPCSFNDRNQLASLTLPIRKRVWYTIGAGFLQRYYDNPFTEFDLDIHYYRLRLNTRIKKIGTVGFQLDRYFADNITYQRTAKASGFDRSYESLEWYMPFKFDRFISYLNHFGFSIRQELRSYNAESLEDPLHAGRNHKDLKFDLWVSKSISESIAITLTMRYRTRNTESVYDWVEELKSFKQINYWCKIKWDFSYDKY